MSIPRSAGPSFAPGWRPWPSLFVRSRGSGKGADDRVGGAGPSGDPAPLLRDRIVDLAFHRGLLLLPCGPSTVRFCPPLCLTAHQVEIGLELFAAAMADGRVRIGAL